MIATVITLLTMILPAAQAPWTGSHCTGHEQITVSSDPLRAADPGYEIDGLAVIGDPQCKVTIEAGMSKLRECVVLTHELGHLAGMTHSTNPNSIMYPTPRVVPARCKIFEPTAARSHSDSWTPMPTRKSRRHN